VCKKELSESEKESELERFDRIVKSFRELFEEDIVTCEYYAHNYIGRCEVHTYRCCQCGTVQSFKPHNFNWYLKEDIQWPKK
jgi:hypothetical protein